VVVKNPQNAPAKSALFAKNRLLGAKNGQGIGTMLFTAPKNAGKLELRDRTKSV
jgi:hypothetical protein